jgi:hypothetical protein
MARSRLHTATTILPTGVLLEAGDAGRGGRHGPVYAAERTGDASFGIGIESFVQLEA